MAVSTIDPNGLNIGQIGGTRNKIINGAMVIDQRNAGAAVTPTADGTYTLDRWKTGLSQASKFSVQQSATAPEGFTTSLLATSLSAYSVLVGDTFLVQQNIEGFNFADLGWGSAGAKTITLSFQVRSSLTGTFGGSLINGGANRSYPFTFEISAADAWEYKTVTISGDTSGTWLTTSGIGLGLRFGLGSGANFSGTAGAWAAGNIVQPTGTVSVVATSGATFYITGVQLEAGDTATPFEHRSYGQELALCQRYYYRITPGAANRYFGIGQVSGANDVVTGIPFPVTMRDRPAALEQSGTASDYRVAQASTSQVACTSVPAYVSATSVAVGVANFVSTSLTGTAGNASQVAAGSVSGYLGWSAEL
jgi:hypothetical protein